MSVAQISGQFGQVGFDVPIRPVPVQKRFNAEEVA